MSSKRIFTSESVTEGHPDKVSDRISDSVLDALLAGDKYSRVACETLTNTNLAVIAGEITSQTEVNYEKIVFRGAIITLKIRASHIQYDPIFFLLRMCRNHVSCSDIANSYPALWLYTA